MVMSRSVRPSEKADILENAADLLETRGWCTGTLWRKDGKRFDQTVEDESNPHADRFCVMGAVMAVAPKRGLRALNPVYDQIEYDYGLRSLIGWNDSQKDKRKVVRLLRRTAKNLRNRKGPFA